MAAIAYFPIEIKSTGCARAGPAAVVVLLDLVGGPAGHPVKLAAFPSMGPDIVSIENSIQTQKYLWNTFVE